jgi:prolyl 4-hydroxylase
MFVYASTPNVAVADGFVYPEECQKIIEASRDKLTRSTIVSKDGDQVDQDRTSTSVGLPHSEFPEVCERLAEVANIPLENAEHMQVARYTKGQEYKPHYDAFKDEVHKKDGGQRLLTCLVYLNNSVGGATAFPNLNIIVGAIEGRLLMFGNVDEDKKPHILSMHQGLSPHEGEKWIFTLWFRERKTNLIILH